MPQTDGQQTNFDFMSSADIQAELKMPPPPQFISARVRIIHAAFSCYVPHTNVPLRVHVLPLRRPVKL